MQTLLHNPILTGKEGRDGGGGGGGGHNVPFSVDTSFWHTWTSKKEVGGIYQLYFTS